MKAYEFTVKKNSDGKINLPDNLIRLLNENQNVRLIVLIDEQLNKKVDLDWDNLTETEFLAGYDEADSIYDKVGK
ncbi:TPA: hypothetical protein ENS27_08025 [bacterium]|nr:hypothetical protein [bacterium]